MHVIAILEFSVSFLFVWLLDVYFALGDCICIEYLVVSKMMQILLAINGET